MKQKIKVLIFSFFVLFLALIIFNAKKVNIPVLFTLETKTSLESETISINYYQNDNLVVLECPLVPEYDEVIVAYNYLTIWSNRIPLDYDTYLVLSSSIISYEIEDSTISLNLTRNFLLKNEEELSYAIKQLKGTYELLGFKSLNIQIEGINQLP